MERNIKLVPVEEMMDHGDDSIVLKDEVVVTYHQEPDCTEDSEGDYQTITFEARNNGTARFINIKTGENGWSVADMDDLKPLFEDFIKSASIPDYNV